MSDYKFIYREKGFTYSTYGNIDMVIEKFSVTFCNEKIGNRKIIFKELSEQLKFLDIVDNAIIQEDLIEIKITVRQGLVSVNCKYLDMQVYGAFEITGGA